MGIYAQHATEYASAGLPAFPVDVRHKRPAVKGWQNATPQRSRAWAGIPKLADADGLGIVMGKPSGIVEVDVDAVGDAWVSAALDRFGETPIVIRTASGKAKLWYRHNGEGRQIRPFNGLPIDVLGGGFTIAPPSWREDLGTAYAFRSGTVANVASLPTIRAGAMADGFTRAAKGVQRGERNDSLWRYCMSQARFCDDVDGLIDVAETWQSVFPEPLDVAEVERCALSAWAYESTGRNYLGLRKPQLNEDDRIMDDLIDQPDALVLLMYFRRWHTNRRSFAIAPTAMSKAGSPPWHYTRIARARDILIARGKIEEVSAPDQRQQKAGRYRFLTPFADSVNNHYTSSPPVYGCELLETGRQ